MFRLRAISLITLLTLALAPAARAHTRPRYGGTLHVEVQSDPWSSSDSLGRRLVYDSLTRIDASGDVVGGLAVRWSSQNNNHRWQFWLRPGVRFHDGTPLTPDIVEQSLARSCTQCPWTSLRKLGDSLVFTTASSDPMLPVELSRSSYAISGATDSGAAAGTGAFRFVSNEGNVLTLAAVDDAWQGRPFVDTVEITGRRVIRTQLLDLSSGQADLIDIPAELVRQAQQERIRIVQSSNCDLLVLTIARTGMLQDDAQREAIALAIDRSALFNAIFQKQGEMSASLLPNGLSGYGFLFPAARDLAHAQSLHGAGTGAFLSLAIDDPGAAVQLAAERIALNLKDAGFHVQVLPRDAAAPNSSAELRLKRIHIDGAEAASSLKEVSETLNQPANLESTESAALYREESAYLQMHQAVPLLYLPRAFGVGVRVRGLRLTPDGMPLLEEISLEDAR